MWCHTTGDEPGIEISEGTEGAVIEFVVADRAGGPICESADWRGLPRTLGSIATPFGL